MPLFFKVLLLLVAASCFSNSVQAHNGYFVVAQSISDISIDGDLSDWPIEMPTNVFIHNWSIYKSPQPVGSFNGRFRVGFSRSENALYIAVEVEDDAIILDSDSDKWNEKDACEIYIATKHSSEAPPAHFLYRSKPDARYRDEHDERLFSAMTVARSSKDRQIVYEWRIDLNRLHDRPIETSQGTVFGFEICYFDRDPDGKLAVYTLTLGANKHLDTNVLGDLLIPPSQNAIVELSGRAIWSEADALPATRLRLRSADHKALDLQIPLKPNGFFILPLLVGDYDLTISRPSPSAMTSHARRLSVTESSWYDDPIELDVNRDLASGTGKQVAGAIYYALAHGEQPVAKLKEFANELGYSLRISTEPISLNALGNSKLLYLRAPTTRFLESEEKAIVRFVENGGSLLLVMDDNRRTSLESTRVNDFLEPFGIRLTGDTGYLHNCGAIAKKGKIHQTDLQLPFNSGRAVEGGSPFGFQLDKKGEPTRPFATSWEGPNGGRVIVLGEAMASLFLGSLVGERLSGDPASLGETTYWGKDSAQFNIDLFAWLLQKAR